MNKPCGHPAMMILCSAGTVDMMDGRGPKRILMFSDGCYIPWAEMWEIWGIHFKEAAWT